MPGRNEQRTPDQRVMSFGKHAGKRYSEVPEHYLRWIVSSAFKGQSRKQGGEAARVRWAREELERRNVIKTL